MNPKGTFFQTTFDGEPAPIELAGFRGRVTAPCPGRTDNTVSLCLGEGCNKFKLSRPKNVGSCEAYVLFYDESGTFIGGHIFQPGDESDGINPKSNTFNVRFGCSPRCGGSAILEFDVYRVRLMLGIPELARHGKQRWETSIGILPPKS